MSITSPFAGREIWLLTGSQGLYGPETLAQVEQQSRVIAEQLDESTAVPVNVVWQPVLTDSEGIRRAVLAANSRTPASA